MKKRVKRIRKARNRRPLTKKELFLILLGGLFLIGIIVGGLYVFLSIQEKTKQIPEPVTESVQPVEEAVPEEKNNIGQAIIDHILKAESEVDKSIKDRPESFEISKENAGSFAQVESCLIDGTTGKVHVTVDGKGIPKSDDKYYYLFALNTYDSGIGEGAEYLDRVYKDSNAQMSTSLNYNHASSRLFKKFVVAVKMDGEYVAVTPAKYITNPEAIAKYSSVYQTPASKKGLLVDPNKLRGNELDELGIKQAAYNIPLGRILGPTSSAAYPTIQYTYNGKTYMINGQVVAEYDIVFGTLTAKGISTTAIILNNWTSSYIQIIHPKARKAGAAPYYMFNATDDSGVECIAAVATFLAERYSGNAHGRISNWVIANEINARKEWNYIEKLDTASYVEEYAKGFRVFYNAIKAVSSSARIYMPLDQQWDRNLKNNPDYDGRDILDEFNRNIKASGNIDWGLAQHPYNVPLTDAKTWSPNKKYISHNAGTSMMSMSNIEVLTNYMQQSDYLTDSGEVRSIILSEQGYTSTAGEAVQAAAIAYAYYKVEANPHIDGFLLNRETDAPEEVAQGLAFGLNHVGGGHKQAYNVYKHLDMADREQYTEFAKSIIGISSWSEILR